jgi:hypothetical protein
MSIPFFYEALPMRVSFGAGFRSKLADEVDKLGLKRVLVLTTEFQRELAQEISDSLGELSVGVYAKAEMHVPIETARTPSDLPPKPGPTAASPSAADPRPDSVKPSPSNTEPRSLPCPPRTQDLK